MIIGEYSPIITEPEASNCFSIYTQVIISKKRKKKKTVQREIIFTYSGKTTTGSHFVRRGDYRLIIRDGEPMRARDFVFILMTDIVNFIFFCLDHDSGFRARLYNLSPGAHSPPLKDSGLRVLK